MSSREVLRIVIAGEHAPARAALGLHLRSDAHELVDASLETAHAEIQRQAPEILLLLLPDAGGLELLRTLRAADGSGRMYVIAVTAEHQPARMVTSAIAAGSHDVLCAPYTVEQLLACVDVRRRLGRWLATRPREVAPGDPAHPKVEELRAWHYLGDVIADDLETMLGRPLRITPGWPAFTDSLQLATITMTMATEQLELCVSIVADTATRQWLGASLLGDAAASDEALDDVMREMANLAGGALKRAARAEGPVLSTGIPVDRRSLPRRESGARCWTIPIDADTQLAVIGEVRHRANRRIPARGLIEGMVVVADVHNGLGTLLLPSGTRLTVTTAERLSALLDTALVEVSG